MRLAFFLNTFNGPRNSPIRISVVHFNGHGES